MRDVSVINHPRFVKTTGCFQQKLNANSSIYDELIIEFCRIYNNVPEDFPFADLQTI